MFRTMIMTGIINTEPHKAHPVAAAAESDGLEYCAMMAAGYASKNDAPIRSAKERRGLDISLLEGL
jgi:hypothetical protein